jgi:hypothetical protein
MEQTLKSSKAEVAAVAAAGVKAKKVLAAASRLTKQERKRQRELAKDIWYQTTKVVVPAWFGNNDVQGGFKLGKHFTAAGLLALVCVGKAGRRKSDTDAGSECEVGMQMNLRPSGFDREEARELAATGFSELGELKLVKRVRKATEDFPYAYYVLSAKGQKWYDLIEKSAGCAPETAD